MRQALRDGDADTCWRTAVMSAELFGLKSSFDERHIELELGSSAATAADDLVAQAAIAYAFGKLYADEQRPGEALECFQRSLGLFRTVDHRPGIGISMIYLAMANRFLGRDDNALECGFSALGFLTDVDHPAPRAHALRGIGQIYLHNAEYAAADNHFERALQLCQTFGPFRRIQAQTQFWQGSLRVRQGRIDEARTMFTQVFAACRELGDLTGTCQALRGLSQCEAAVGDVESARATLRHALDLAEQPRPTLTSSALRQDLERLNG
jgi:tetratricopeptide (TPR) repeat protein